MPKSKPKTGEPREANQPLKIDRLPPTVHEAILVLRNQQGKTWDEIEQISALKLDKGGFVDWENLPTRDLELFPDMKLPHTTLHRWYDLRVAQVREMAMDRSRIAREVAESFVAGGLTNGSDAVMNAATDTIFGFLAEDSSDKGRMKAAAFLLKLGEVMNKAKTNEIRERAVTVDEKALQLKLDTIKAKTGELLKTIQGEDGKPAVPLTTEEYLKKLGEIYGIAG